MPRYFLGVDGGQSSTTAIIGDETGRVLGVGRGGPCNHVGASEGRAKFVDAIQASLRAACAQAGLPSWRALQQRLPGIQRRSRRTKNRSCTKYLRATGPWSPTTPSLRWQELPRGEPGLVVIAGTGSIAFGRDSRGRTARAGGWGYLFGDEGGGFWIARQALRAALRLEEGWGVPTSLRGRLLDATGARNINDLLHRCYTAEFPRPRVASLSVLVNHAAEIGDPVAVANPGYSRPRTGPFGRRRAWTIVREPASRRSSRTPAAYSAAGFFWADSAIGWHRKLGIRRHVSPLRAGRWSLARSLSRWGPGLFVVRCLSRIRYKQKR